MFGVYSSYKEVKSLVVVYTAVSVLLLSVLVMGGVIAYVFRHQIETNMKAGLMSDLRRYDPADNSAITQSWDRTQARLQCCGIKTIQVEEPWQIWSYNIALNPGPGLRVPQSCCRPGLQCGPDTPVVPSNIWTEDCYVKVGRQLRYKICLTSHLPSGHAVPAGAQPHHGLGDADSGHYHGESQTTEN